MKYFFFINLIFLFSFSYSQIKKITDEYSNGNIKAIGKVLTCPNYDERYTCDETGEKCKKIGKWIYYYQSGIIQRIENYKRIKNCNSNAIREGIWQYYNDKGLKIKEEEYRNDKLWNAEISKYYFNTKLAGEIKVINGIFDTLKYIDIDSLNLIKNGNFGLYSGQPQLEILDGQNRIEAQIPFWITPNSNTPDYYNQFRRLIKVSDNVAHDYNSIYNYVGIILYHEPTGYYSEYITVELNSQLKSKRKYCLRITLRLSQNSGYYLDRFGVYFSKDIPKMPNTIERQKCFPQIEFNKLLDNRNDWITLCRLYSANGDERHLTIGRFTGLTETYINKIIPVHQSEGEYNQSAYYLFDKLELFEDTTKCDCEVKKPVINLINRLDFSLLNPEDSLSLMTNKTFILKNIYFDFDKSILLPNSFKELEKLYELIKLKNKSITISGHTDSIGSDEYNKALSLSRAKAVSDWLIEKGIDSRKIKIEGYGAKIPIVDNNTIENRAINRRVEFSFDK